MENSGFSNFFDLFLSRLWKRHKNKGFLLAVIFHFCPLPRVGLRGRYEKLWPVYQLLGRDLPKWGFRGPFRRESGTIHDWIFPRKIIFADHPSDSGSVIPAESPIQGSNLQIQSRHSPTHLVETPFTCLNTNASEQGFVLIPAYRGM